MEQPDIRASVSSRLTLDTISRNDLPALRACRNNESTRMNLSMAELISEDQQLKWFESLSTAKDSRYLVARSESGLVGLIRITQIDLVNGNACVGCDVMPDFRGRGLGKAVMGLAVYYCVNILNLGLLWLLVADGNQKAKKVYESCGFIETGRLPGFLKRNGSEQDYILMCRRGPA